MPKFDAYDLIDTGAVTNSNLVEFVLKNSHGPGTETQRINLTQLGTLLATGVADGDKGDITVSASGATWTIDNSAVSYAKIQNVSGTDKLLGRSTAGAGVIEEISCTSLGRSIIAAATASSARTVLDAASATHGHLASDVTDGVFDAARLGTGSSITTKFLRGDSTWQSLVGLTDGDKGDITVSASGATWTIDNSSVTYTKLQNVSATDRILGRSTAGAGVVEEITCTAYGRSLLDDVDATAARTTLGLGTLATQSGTFSGTSSGTNTGDQTITLTGNVTGSGTGSFATTIANSAVTYAKIQNVSATDRLLGRSSAGSGVVEEITCTSFGRSLLDDADASAARTTLGLGTLATQSGTVSGTNTGDQTITLTGDVTGSGTGSFAATIANSAVTYAKIQNVSATDKILGRSTAGAGIVEEITCTSYGRSLLDDVDAAAARTTLGLGTLATQSGTFSGTSSGTNTGDQTITLSGDASGSGTGAVTVTIANDAVTYAKIQNISDASRLLGRGSAAGAGDTQELTLGTGLELSGTTLNCTVSGAALADGDKGDITVSASGATWTIDNSAVTYAKIQNVSATDKILGRSTAGAGVVEEITCTSYGRSLLDDVDAAAARTTLGLGTLATQSGTFSGTSSGTNTGDQTITLSGDVSGTGTGSFTTTIASDSVTYAKMQNVSAASRILGRGSAGGSGDPEELTIGTGLSLSGTTLSSTVTGVSDGDKGDITVSASGATWTIDNSAVSYAKIQNVSATDKLLGRSSAGAGVIEEVTCTAYGRSLLDDVDAAAARTTLGLGTLATQSGTFSGTSSGTNTGDQTVSLTGDVTGSGTGSFAATISANAVTTTKINNSAVTYAKIQDVSATDKLLGRSTAGAGVVEEITCTAFGRSLIDDADATTARTTLGLGTLATQSGTFSGTSSGVNTGDQTISLTGDVTGSGTGSFATTLASVGTAGTYTKVTTDAKGRVSSGTTLAASDIPTLTAAKISDFDTQVRTSRLDQMAAPTASVSLNNQKITNLAAPSSDTDAASKAYVDAIKQGLDVKDSVRVATTANITLSGTQTIDGVAVVAGDRVLVKNQNTASANGIYVVAAGAWTRAIDADADADVTTGMFTFVAEGTANADSGWILTTDGTITLGTTSLTFTQFSGAGQITAGAGLTKTANTIDAVGTSNRITVNADSIDIASTYVGQNTITTLGTITTGTWNGTTIAVANGGTGVTTSTGSGSVVLSTSPTLVTPLLGTPTSGTLTNCTGYTFANLASKPTTLSGYGITDAQPLDADLTAIAALAGTSGFLKKTAADTWTLDTSTYLTGNQSITISGDATGSGSTAITLTLANSGVTGGTYNNSATAVTPLTVDAKGRITATGAAVTITPAWSSITSKPTTLSGFGITDALSNSTTSTQSGYFGDIYLYDDSTPSHYLAITNSANLTLARTLSLNVNDADRTISLSGNLTVPSAATVSGTNTGDQTITLTGNVTGSGTGSFATTIANSVVTNAMLSNVATQTFKGRTTASTGVVEDLTATQATAMLDLFTSTAKGLTPLSGGGTTNYLRADGTWASPPGTATTPGGATTQVQYNNAGAFAGSANLTFDGTNTILGSGSMLQWSTDTMLQRDAANTIAQRNAASAQTFRIYNTYTSGTSFERLSLTWATNVAKIGTEKGTAGTARDLQLMTDGADRINITAAGVIRFNNAYTFPTADGAANKVLVTNGAGALSFSSGTLTGTNTGDQTITLTGDVTGSGSGSFAATIANSAVSYAKIQNVSATDKLLGRSTAGAGVIEEITCTAFGRSLIDDADATAARTTLGLGTLATQSGTFSGTSSGTNTGDQTITLTGNVTGSGTGSFATTIANSVVTNAMLSNVATQTFKGRTTASTGVVEDLTATQATAMLDVFSSSLKGLAPASGGGTSNFLRADGTWAAPAGGSGSPGGSTTQLQYNNAGEFAGASGLTTSGTTLSIAGGTVTSNSPILNLTQTWNNAAVAFTALDVNVTPTAAGNPSSLLNLRNSGTSVYSVDTNGALWFNYPYTGIQGLSTYGINFVTSGIVYNGVSGGYFTSAGGYGIGATMVTADTYLQRDEERVFAVMGTYAAAQLLPNAFRIYNTFTSTTNYERGVFDWKTSANVFRIGTEKGSGGGTGRALSFVTGDTERMSIAGTGGVTINTGGSSFTLPTGRGTSNQVLQTDGAGGTSWATVSASPGGSTTQIQYNNAGAFAGASGLTTSGTNLTIAGGTLTNTSPSLNVTQTWNNVSATFTAATFNVTDTASGSQSLILDCQVGGASRFSVSKSGNGTFSSSVFVAAGGGITWASRSSIYSSADGFFEFTANNGTTGAVVSSGGYKVTSDALVTSSPTSNNFNLLASHNGKTLIFSSSTAFTITVASTQSYPVGFSCTVITTGAGAATFTASSVTINSFGNYLATAGAHSVATLICTASNVFNLAGNLV